MRPTCERTPTPKTDGNPGRATGTRARSAPGKRLPILTGALIVPLLAGCFLRERSVLHPVHPQAEVLMEGATEASFSPDGRWIAFVRLEGGKAYTADIYVLERKTGKQRRITSNPDYDGQPSWAPDSRLLVFTSRRKGLFNLYLASIEQRDERQLTWAGGRQPHFSPDGVSIVYTSDELGSLDVFLTSPSGGIARRLTEGPGREWFPRYSPDGRWIAYVSDRAGSDDLWLLHRESGEHRRLTSLPGEELHPCWSPDSRLLVFSGGPPPGAPNPHQRDLYAVRADAGPAADPPLVLTGCDGLLCQNTSPAFSPDGSLLVFTVGFNPLQLRLARLAVHKSALAPLLGKG